jgi:hypothetical protein
MPGSCASKDSALQSVQASAPVPVPAAAPSPASVAEMATKKVSVRAERLPYMSRALQLSDTAFRGRCSGPPVCVTLITRHMLSFICRFTSSTIVSHGRHAAVQYAELHYE